MWRSIHGRLLLVFLLALLPVYLIGLLIYAWGVNSMRDAMEKRSLTQIETYCNNFEKDIKRLVNLQVELINSREIAWLANMNRIMSDYERGMAIEALSLRLRYLSNSSIYSGKATAYLNTLDIRVDSLGSVESLSGQSAKDPINDRRQTMEIHENSGFPLFVSGEGLYTHVVFRVGKAEVLYSISIDLSEEQIKQELNHLNPADGFMVAIYGGGLKIIRDGSCDGNDADYPRLLFEKSRQSSDASGLFDAKINGKKYQAMFSRCENIDFTLISIVPYQSLYEPVNRYVMMLWVYLFAGLAILILFHMFIRRSIYRPMQILIQAFQRIEKNDLDTDIAYKRNDEYGYLFESYNHMLKKLCMLIRQNYEQAILLRDAELKQLQAQINPHFLYNSYFLLHRMIQSGDKERAWEFSGYLGKYMQYITRNARDLTALRHEAEHARNYTRIQGMRFDGRITIQFDELPKEFSDYLVPRLILQPLIENSFEHGLRNKRTDGYLHIAFDSQEKDVLSVIVEDNGDELADASLGRLFELIHDSKTQAEYTALRNIESRIKLRYGKNSGLSFSRSLLGGLRVELAIRFPHKEAKR